eukprot:symbB.v1.2.011204.t1/scaffold718.1/size169569/10
MSFFWGVILYSVVWYSYISCVSTMPVQWVLQLHEVSRNGLRPGQPGLPRLRARAIDFRASELFVYTHLCILDPRQHRHNNAWTRGSKKCPVSDPTRLWQGLQLLAASEVAGVPWCGIGEAADIAYAPVQGIALMILFRSMGISALGFTEEILPFTDFIPTATLAWILDTFFPESCLGRFCGFDRKYRGADTASDSSSESEVFVGKRSGAVLSNHNLRPCRCWQAVSSWPLLFQLDQKTTAKVKEGKMAKLTQLSLISPFCCEQLYCTASLWYSKVGTFMPRDEMT